MSIAYGCAQGWLHVNADWVLLEPVDDAYRPVPPGAPSHTVLLTNLANRVQPVIRYDLGDSVMAKPEPCACGSPLPAILVEGRRDDVISLRAPDGSIVRLLPLALTTVVEDAAPGHRFQIVQTAADRLLLRLHTSHGADRPGGVASDRAGLAPLSGAAIAAQRACRPRPARTGGRFAQRQAQGSRGRDRRRMCGIEHTTFGIARMIGTVRGA